MSRHQPRPAASGSIVRGALRRDCCAITAMAVMLVLASCARFVPPERSAAEIPVPEAFTMYGPASPAPERWWWSFDSPELNALVEQALAGNFTIQRAAARIIQAAAVARQARALRWPEFGYDTETSVAQSRIDTGEPAPVLDSATRKLGALDNLLAAPSAGQSPARSAQTRLNALETLLSDDPSPSEIVNTESYQLGLAANYEADLWGRLRASHEAARLDFEASREDLFAAMQTLAAQVVLTWLDILLDEQVLAVARKQVETNQTNLELIELRFRKGSATALDVLQQRQAVAQAAAAIPPVEAELQTLKHALAVLLGEPPRTGLELGSMGYPELGPLPEQGIPAHLLARRPDVRAAGLRLSAADWRVSAARADRLPALRLTGSASYNSGEWELLFDNWTARLAASVTGPIFDAGRRKAEVARTRAVVDERLNAYKETVLIAVTEVEDALVLETRQREYVRALRDQLEAARASYEEASNRYRKGLNDYLPVLSALTALQVLERTVVRAEHDLRVFRVQLHLALGGDWMEEMMPALAEEDMYD